MLFVGWLLVCLLVCFRLFVILIVVVFLFVVATLTATVLRCFVISVLNISRSTLFNVVVFLSLCFC